MTEQDAMIRAQNTINAALAELESATGGYVRSLEIVDIDARTFTDDRPQLKRRVVIDIDPRPGTNWLTE